MKLLRNLFVIAAMVFGMSSVAQAACRNDVLASRSGEILVMRSGAIYRVLDNPDRATFWLPLGRLTICAHGLVTVNGEMAAIYEIRNQDATEVVKAERER